MSALTDRIAAEHVFHWIEDRPRHGPFAAMLPGCTCGIALDSGFTDHAAHIANVTEAAVREQVARDIEDRFAPVLTVAGTVRVAHQALHRHRPWG